MCAAEIGQELLGRDQDVLRELLACGHWRMRVGLEHETAHRDAGTGADLGHGECGIVDVLCNGVRNYGRPPTRRHLTRCRALLPTALAQSLMLGTKLELNTLDPHFFNAFPTDRPTR